MTEFTRHTPATAPDAAKPLLEGAEKNLGFIPGLYSVMAEEPPLLDAYFKVHEAFGKTGLSQTERHVVWLEANVQNDCHYCVPAHTMMAKGDGVSEDIIEALRTETPIADERLEALRQFTRKMVLQRGDVSADDVNAFLAAGFERRAVLGVILGLAQKVMSNYTNAVAETPVDPAFQQFAWEKAS